MKKILFYCSLFAGVALFTTSCEKDDDTPKTNAELILGTWQMTAATIDPPAFTTGSDLYATFEECDKDDLYTFEEGTVAKLDEGTTKCNDTDPQTYVGTYAFNPDETILTTVIDGETTSSAVVSLGESSMVLEETINANGQENKLTFTFTKQ